MPDPDRLLTTIRQAVAATRATPGRRGRFVEPAGAAEVLVAGDLHGHVENFRLLLRRADLARHPGRHLVLQELVHGTFSYPAGGEKSHQLLDLFAALKCQYPPRVHMLLGNHEMAQWTGRQISKDNVDLNDLFRQGVDTAYGPKGAEVYAAYLDLFAALPLALRTPNRIFLSHSLPPASRLPAFELAHLEREEITPDDWGRDGPFYPLLWGRDTAAATAAAFLEKVDADLLITGHIVCEQGYAAPNDRQLILDSHGTPACCCLFPTDRPLTHEELLARVEVL